MESLKPILKNHPFFKGFSKESLELVVGCASNARFKDKEFIFKEGESADKFYLIREGRVSLEIPSPTNKAIAIQTLSDGEVLGFSWLFPPYKWSFDARVVDSIRAIAIDGKCLREKCEKDHSLGYELQKLFAQIMVDRLQATRIQLLDLYEVPSAK